MTVITCEEEIELRHMWFRPRARYGLSPPPQDEFCRP